MTAAGGTDVGRKRGHNEDSFGVYDDLGLYLVADGMGGHAAGEVASGLAVDTVKASIGSTASTGEVKWPFGPDPELGLAENRLVAGIRLANIAIRAEARMNPERTGMGTTVVAVLVDGDDACIAHVGDSRAYLFRDGGLTRLTSDHSFVEEMVAAGSLTPEQADAHPLKNLITRALGSKDEVQADVTRLRLREGDVILLCSDGLSGMVAGEEMADIMADNFQDPRGCVDALVERANEHGGLDNITAVIIKAA